jgi:hypothetical protein
MAAPKFPIINGNHFGPASVEVDLRGRTYLGVSAINYADELQRETVFGLRSVGLGSAVGQYIATVDFEMVLSESERFLADLGTGYGVVPFNIGISHVEQPGAGTIIVEIMGATITKLESGIQKGSTGTVDKYTLHVVTPIRRNGRTIVEDALGGADIAATLSAIALG